jgi:hypothetical protein
MSDHASWEFGEGEEIRPGRAVLKTIGGCAIWSARSTHWSP